MPITLISVFPPNLTHCHLKANNRALCSRWILVICSQFQMESNKEKKKKHKTVEAADTATNSRLEVNHCRWIHSVTVQRSALHTIIYCSPLISIGVSGEESKVSQSITQGALSRLNSAEVQEEYWWAWVKTSHFFEVFILNIDIIWLSVRSHMFFIAQDKAAHSLLSGSLYLHEHKVGSVLFKCVIK